MLLLLAGAANALPTTQLAPMRLRGGAALPAIQPKSMSTLTAGFHLATGLGYSMLPADTWAAGEGKVPVGTELLMTEIMGKEALTLAVVVWALGRGESLCTAGMLAALLNIALVMRFVLSRDYAKYMLPKEPLVLVCGLMALWAYVAGRDGAGLVDGDAFIKGSAAVLFVLTALPDLLTPVTHCSAYGIKEVSPRAVTMARTSGVLRAAYMSFAFLYKDAPMQAMAATWGFSLANLLFGLSNQDFVQHGITTKPFFWTFLLCSYMLYASFANMKA